MLVAWRCTMAMFSLYTYHHLPKFQHALWYSPNWIQRVSRVSSGAKDYITLLLSNHLQSLRATLWKCFLNQRQTTDWVPIEGSWMTQNTMFSNMWKFATTVRENFDDLQILRVRNPKKIPEIIVEFSSPNVQCFVPWRRKQSIRLSGRVGVLQGELCTAQEKMTRNISKLTVPCYLLHFGAKPVLCWILERKCAICTVHRLLKHNRVGSKWIGYRLCMAQIL